MVDAVLTSTSSSGGCCIATCKKQAHQQLVGYRRLRTVNAVDTTLVLVHALNPAI